MSFTDPLDLFLKHAAERPGHLAVVESKREITYGGLADLAARMAHHFRQVGEHPKVLIHLPQSIEAYAAMMGTLLAGGFYSPTNTSAPVDRQKLVIDRFQPDIIISNTKLLAELDGDYTTLDIAEIGEERLGEPAPAHDLAYIIFTSGSTGIPKGVMIARDSLAHYTDWAIRDMAITPDDRWSQHPNIGFDLSVLDIYGALCGGATLYPIDNPRDKLMPTGFIKRHQLTIWDSVPSVIDLMIRSRKMDEAHLASLRLITFCGEPLLKEHLDAIFAARPDITVHNTYGPTEATVSFTLLPLTKDTYLSACGSHSVAFGEAIPGMGLHLIDGEHDNEGEIVISGPQVARGYWQDPERTAAAFQTMDIGGEPTYVYRTGDWGYRKDGHIFFGTRLDRQVKINGYRLELGEVDAAFRKAGAHACCTVMHDGELHAFIEETADLDLDAVKAGATKLLPPYAVPAQVSLVKQLPRNANDKIDAKALQAELERSSFNGNH